MGTGQRDQVVDPQPIADNDSYMNRTEAAEFLGVSQSTLMRFEAARQLTPYREAGGGKRARVVYRESDVFSLRKHPTSETETELAMAPAEILKNAARAMETSQTHVKTMLEPVMKMQEMLLTQSTKAIEVLQARCAHLDNEIFQFIDMQKTMLRADSDAEVERTKVTEGIKMRRDAFDRVVGYFPLLATMVGDKYGGTETKTRVRESALIDIVDRLDVEQIEQLQRTAVFDQSSMSTIIALKERLVSERKKRLQQEIDSEAAAAAAVDGDDQGGNGRPTA